MREFLRTYNQAYHTTILLTSHYMSDVEALCDRVILIDDGRLFFDGALEDVIARFADFKLVTVRLENAPDLEKPNLQSYGEIIEQSHDCIKLKVARNRVIPVCRALLEQFPVADMDIEEVSIEEIVRNLFARPDPAAAIAA